MTSELRPAVEVWREAFETWACEPEHDNAPEEAAAVIEADREAVRAEQAAELAKWKEQRLLDHGRLLWREDVETHCPNADLCFEYSATVRCSPCAIKQSDAEGVEALSLNNVYQPEVARLNRELAKFKALAETLAGAVKAFMPTHINLRMPHPDDSFIVPLDVNMGELRALDAALRKWEEARDAS